MIVVDVSAAVHRRAGLGRYAESLVRALVQVAPDQAVGPIGLFYNKERGVTPLAGLGELSTRTVSLGYKPWRMLVWLGQLAGLGFDPLVPGAQVFHATEHLLLPMRRTPTVLTVHDLIFRHLPEHHKTLNRLFLNASMPLFCRRADRIIAVSQCTKRDLVDAYGVAADRITVVYEAASPIFRPPSADAISAAMSRLGLPARYVLSVGTIEPRKNLTRLLHAFESAALAGLSDALVIVGRAGWLCNEFFAAVEASQVRDRVILPGFVPDEDLPGVYGGAQASVTPSLYEGFGLPVLEAMACGTPVICSSTSSLGEISGDAALHVDPTETSSIVAALHTLLADAALRDMLRQRGLQRAAGFSWARVASETMTIYGSVARNGPLDTAPQIEKLAGSR